MSTWLEKVARAAMMAASNQFLGTNSMGTPGAGAGIAHGPRPLGARLDLSSPGPTGPAGPAAGITGQKDLAAATAGTLAQETITHGDAQNKVNTSPIRQGMVHPGHAAQGIQG